MGQSFGKIVSKYCPDSVLSVYRGIGLKRKRSESDEEDGSVLEQLLNKPKKIKLACTTEYIYRALFLEGGSSDITVDVLGKEWKLHRIYLQQCPYFASMFSGSWNESNKTYIKIEVADANITTESLKVVFGSLYFDEPTITPNTVVSILAAATLFQMDGFLEQCINVMVDHINSVTALEYYTAACQYGIQPVKQATKEWFCVNLMDHYKSNPKKLKDLDEELMGELVKSPELIVIPAEYSLYGLLKLWMYMRLNPTAYKNSLDDTDMKQFYMEREDIKIPFLLTEEGNKYIGIFEGLHIHNLFLHMDDLNNVLQDRIIPESWLFPHLLNQYKSVLKVCQLLESGPTEELPLEEFQKHCVRCGRILKTPDISPWHWRLYNFGLRLIWTIIDNTLRVQIICNDEVFATPEESNYRHVWIRVKVASINEYGHIARTLSSGLIKASMVRRTELKVLELGKDIEYPLILGVNMLNVTPDNKV